MPIQEKNPIMVRDTPACASQADSVENTSRNGNPEEKPRKPMPMTRGWPYTVHASRHRCKRAASKPAGSELDIIIQRQRRMIGQALFPVYGFGDRLGRQPRRRHMVVDAPSDVVVPGAAAIRPPGELVRIRVDAAKHIHQPEFVEYLVHPRALVRQKARILAVVLPVLEIDFLVRDIP